MYLLLVCCSVIRPWSWHWFRKTISNYGTMLFFPILILSLLGKLLCVELSGVENAFVCTKHKRTCFSEGLMGGRTRSMSLWCAWIPWEGKLMQFIVNSPHAPLNYWWQHFFLFSSLKSRLWLVSPLLSSRCYAGFTHPTRSMLSAVELHTGPGGIGIYSHHPPFGRPTTSNLQQMPIVSTAHVQQQQVSSMSGAEFARPKPKNIGSLNGITSSSTPTSSPTLKYSHHEQNGPVNLAVNHQTSSPSSSSRGSPPSKSEHLDQKDIDVVGLGNSSSGSIGAPMSYATASSRISSYPSGLGTNAYQALNYSFYGSRYG